MFKKNFALLVLAMSLAGSVKAANKSSVFLDALKYSGVAGAAYAATDGLLSKFYSQLSPDMQATVSAAVAVASVVGLSKYEARVKNNDSLKFIEDGKTVLSQSAKPFVVLGTLKFGMPALNWLFTNFVKIDKMVTKNQISVIDAQKIVLAYITVAKALDNI